MIKVRAIVVAILVFYSNLSSFAQRWEIGFGAGISYYTGDLNPTAHFKFPNPAGTIFVKRILTPHWAIRGNFTYMGIHADDSQGDFSYQLVRNLNFRSHVFELHAAAELNFFPFAMNPHEYQRKIKKWTPYFFAGVGAYYNNPVTLDTGEELLPLGTEGQGTTINDRAPYSLVMPCMPFGLGFKFNIKNKFAINIEYGMRLTFSDYIDDVSTDYSINSVIANENGVNAAVLSNRAGGPYSDLSNDFYQRGIKTDLDWIGYLGVSLVFYIKDPTSCSSGVKGGHGTSKLRNKTSRK